MSKIKLLKQNGFNFLWIDDDLWMWDIPVEQKAQRRIAQKAYGDVLVAGYGLGIVHRYLARNKKVKSIITVEKLPAVIALAKKAYGRIYGDIVIGDFYKYDTSKKFDCVIGDVWKDIYPEALAEYKRYEKKAKLLVKENNKILAWGQEFFKAIE